MPCAGTSLAEHSDATVLHFSPRTVDWQGKKLMNLATLELTRDELEKAQSEIRHLAFEKWRGVGCPDADPLEFWLEAEKEWIAFQYVPDRKLAQKSGS
jgi:hypothetical protein